MLGFGKKKKNKKDSTKKELPKKEKKKSGKDKPDKGDSDSNNKGDKKTKKRIPVKIILITLMILSVVGVSGYFAYTWFTTSKDPASQEPVYTKIDLPHLALPEEMLKFSFTHFPDLYVAMITFNHQIDLFDNEISRIDAIAQKYPEQKKIAEKEKKSWEKAKKSLQKTFLKIEKPVKETYVLFQVNTELGLAQIKLKNKELTQLAQNALVPAQEVTRNLKATEEVPQGIIKGTYYKLKKKFL